MPLPSYNFRWFRDTGRDNELPAEMLAEALRAAQRAFQLAGMIVGGVDRTGERVRARVPADIARKYILRCHPAVEGSFDLPTTLGYDELVDDPSLLQVAALFDSAVSLGGESGNAAPLGLSPGAITRAFLLAVAEVAPPRGSGWALQVRSPHNETRTLTEDAHRRLEQIVRDMEASSTVETATVTGELRAIDFANKALTILYPIDQRKLQCRYSIADEITLINHRLNLVHVTGRVIRDASGRITEIDEVEKIEPLDLSQIQVGRVDTSAGVLRARSVLSFTPTQDPDSFSQWMSVEYEPLGLVVTAPTRSTLVDAIREELAFLWEEYVVDSSPLEPGAERLRSELQGHFEVIQHATR